MLVYCFDEKITTNKVCRGQPAEVGADEVVVDPQGAEVPVRPDAEVAVSSPDVHAAGSDGADVVPPGVPFEDTHPDRVDAVVAEPAVAAAEISDDTVLADLLPRAAAAAPAPAPRLPLRDYVGVWKDVACNSCDQIAGQVKYDPQPGSRDNATWFMRVRVPGQSSWGSRFPHFRRRTSQVIGESEDFALDWVQTNKTCCRGT